MSGVAGVSRFLNRVWRIVMNEEGALSARVCDSAPAPEIVRLLHKAVRSVTEGIETLRFNTAIAKLMEMSNTLLSLERKPRVLVETFVLLLSPFAPHLAEELWSRLGYQESLAYAPWPSFDPALAEDDVREYVVQVNGKLRHKLLADAGLSAAKLIETVKADPRVTELLRGQHIAKEVAVAGRLVNFVVRD
jgi:leucyl-tRNA synthetase